MHRNIVIFCLLVVAQNLNVLQAYQSVLTCDPLLIVVLMVKDEGQVGIKEPIIVETLRPFIDGGVNAFFVYDTGSTDDTIKLAQELFDSCGIARAYIVQEDFIDFASSRNRALQLAQEKFPNACFMLMPDAEWYIHNVQGLLEFCKQEAPNICNDSYTIRTIGSLQDYTQRRLIRCHSGAKFVGAVHESLAARSNARVPSDIYFRFRRSQASAERSAKRWKRDLAILQQEYEKNPRDSRNVFYLAQTYECLEDWEHAYQYFAERVQLGGCDHEEVFVAHLRLGQMAEEFPMPEGASSWPLALAHYLEAYSFRPGRAEPLIYIAHHYVQEGKHELAYHFAQWAAQIPYPSADRLFVVKYLYDYVLWNVLGQSAWYVGQFEVGEAAVRKALQVHPDKQHLHQNLEVYLERKTLTPVVL